MSIKTVKTDYGTGTNEILQFPDHYVAYAQVISKDSALAVTVGSRKIVKAGTLFPNSVSPVGLVLNDADVTDGDVNGAILVHGFVNIAKLPAEPTTAQKELLPNIGFYPLAARRAIPTTLVTSIAAGDGIAVDSTNPAIPSISATGVQSIVAGDGIDVDSTNPKAPIVSAESAG